MKIVAIKPKYSTRRRSPDPQKPMKFEDMFAAKLEKQVNDLTPIVFGKSMTFANLPVLSFANLIILVLRLRSMQIIGLFRLQVV